MTLGELVFATRPSALARWQTGWVIQQLGCAWSGLECREEVITTQGDLILDKPLPEIGGKGLFTLELEAALHCGSVHAAVHSLKDLPIENSGGLTLGAIPKREEPRDVLISPAGWTLDILPEGSVVGTSSLRRAAQLLAHRPDLVIKELRGNVGTRIRKVERGEYAAIVLAGAGVIRLGLERHISQWLPLEVMLPAPGQGALAVQCRADDASTLRMLRTIDDPPSRLAVTAERTFLAGLGGGCSLPVAALAQYQDGKLLLTTRVSAPDGSRTIDVRLEGDDPVTLGVDCARQALDQGAAHLLSTVNLGR